MSRLVRLDYTSPFEHLSRGLFYLLGMGMLLGVFALAAHMHASEAERQTLVVLMLLGLPPTMVAGWAAQSVDDTYWLDLDRRNLLEQKSRILKVQMDVLKSFEELKGVAVDYRYDSPPFSWLGLLDRHKRVCNQYSLVFLTQDGEKIQVTDWLEEGYSQISGLARQVGEWTQLPVFDEGPQRDLEIKVSLGRVRVRLKPSFEASFAALIGLLAWFGIVGYYAWKLFTSL